MGKRTGKGTYKTSNGYLFEYDHEDVIQVVENYPNESKLIREALVHYVRNVLDAKTQAHGPEQSKNAKIQSKHSSPGVEELGVALSGL